MYKIGDIVEFEIGDQTLKYEIRSNYFHYIGSHSNGIIFKMLGIKDPKQYCFLHYGYKAEFGGWPEYKRNDLGAISRIIEGLQKDCKKFNEGKNISITTKTTTISTPRLIVVKERGNVYKQI